MGLLDIFKRKEEPLEVSPEEQTPERHVTVRIETMGDFVDIDRITRMLKEGNIVFIRAKELQRKDLGEFQNCVAKLKRVAGQYGWDLVGTEEGYLLATPQSTKIIR